MIYFIQGAEGTPIKIGFSSDVRERLAALQTAHHCKLRILGGISGSQAVEAALHRRFARYRVEGEWFLACEEILSFIADACDVAFDGTEESPLKARDGAKENRIASQLTLSLGLAAALREAYGEPIDWQKLSFDAGISADHARAWAAGDGRLPSLVMAINLARANVVIRQFLFAQMGVVPDDLALMRKVRTVLESHYRKEEVA